MALPASGAITLGAIGTEFGDTTPNSLSEFYRGGSLVKGSNTFNQNIPTSGVIRLSNFYSAAKVFQYNVGGTVYSSPWDLRINAVTAGWNQSDKLLVVTSSTTFQQGIVVSGSFPNGVGLELDSLTLVTGSLGAQGTAGARGSGGLGGSTGGNGNPGSAGGAAGNGATGGTAISTTVAITINNYGTISGGTGGAAGVRSGGGGGGGGGGGYIGGVEGNITLYTTGGTGGFGYSLSTGGPTAGSAGGTNAGSGGNGGGVATAGAAGSGGFVEGGPTTSGGSGGAAGAAGTAGAQGNYIVGNSLVTWINTGSRTGGVVA